MKELVIKGKGKYGVLYYRGPMYLSNMGFHFDKHKTWIGALGNAIIKQVSGGTLVFKIGKATTIENIVKGEK